MRARRAPPGLDRSPVENPGFSLGVPLGAGPSVWIWSWSPGYPEVGNQASFTSSKSRWPSLAGALDWGLGGFFPFFYQKSVAKSAKALFGGAKWTSLNSSRLNRFQLDPTSSNTVFPRFFVVLRFWVGGLAASARRLGAGSGRPAALRPPWR